MNRDNLDKAFGLYLNPEIKCLFDDDDMERIDKIVDRSIYSILLHNLANNELFALNRKTGEIKEFKFN